MAETAEIVEAMPNCEIPTQEVPDKELVVGSLLEVLVSKYADMDMFGTRAYNEDGSRGDFEFETYAEVFESVKAFAAGLMSLGLERGSRVGIMSTNRVEWHVCDFACAMAGFISVPLYDTQGIGDVEYVVNEAEVEAVLIACDRLHKWVQVHDKCSTVRHVIAMDHRIDDRTFLTEHGKAPEGVDGYTTCKANLELTNQADIDGLKCVSTTYEAVVKAGKDAPETTFPEVDKDDVLTYVYTSGTTGNPKGAIITHHNCLFAATSMTSRIINPTPEIPDTLVSFLPNAHIFMRVVSFTMLLTGSRLAFYRGDILGLMEDIGLAKPTVLIMVPRVFQRIFDKVMRKLDDAPGIRQWMFATAFESKRHKHFVRHKNSPVWDKIVFSKLKAMLGGRVREMFSGSAPLPPKIGEFATLAFCAFVGEGYGLTETCACATAQDYDPFDRHNYYHRMGDVGPPLPGTEIKLVSVPELEYLASDKPNPRGEIYLRGPHVFKGYYKDDERTASVFADDGWFKTGDVGELRPDGTLKIIDRIKNIFKLAQGEFVCAETLEMVYKQNRAVTQCFIYGSRYESYVLAVIVPDEGDLKGVARDAGVEDLERPLAELCCDKAVIAAMRKSIVQTGKDAGMRGFEIPKAIVLEPVLWDVENDFMTPSFKLRRKNLKLRYIQRLHAMYAAFKGLEDVRTASDEELAAIVVRSVEHDKALAAGSSTSDSDYTDSATGEK